jgi:hypothetical protein
MAGIGSGHDLRRRGAEDGLALRSPDGFSPVPCFSAPAPPRGASASPGLDLVAFASFRNAEKPLAFMASGFPTSLPRESSFWTRTALGAAASLLGAFRTL